MKKNSSKFLLLIILSLALALRLYKIDIPLADHHSWRQADTAAVARNFIKDGFDFLRPKIDNMAPVHAPHLPNPERLFLAEPPVYNSIVALVYSVFGVKEGLARLVSVFFSLGSIIFLFLLVKDSLGEKIALWTSFFSAVIPFNVFYNRVILPEPMMIFFSLGMIYFFQSWLQGAKKSTFLVAIFFAAFSLTQKIFPLFLSLPMAYLVLKKWGFGFLKKKKVIFSFLIYLFLAVLPIFLWRLWVARFPEGVPQYQWLFNEGGIRFRPAFFRWIFAERIGKLILGYWGLPLFAIGLILKPSQKLGWFYHWWFLSFLIYLTVFAAGNVTHDYYQIPFIPLAAVFLAKGSDWLLNAPRRYFSRITCRVLLIVCIIFMLGFSWYHVRDFYFIQGGVDLAGRAVDQLTPKNALVLTGDSNDATLLYNCNRHGWTGGYASYFPNVSESIEKVRLLGADYYVTTKVNQLKDSGFGSYMEANFKIIQETDQYIVFDLK